MKLIRIYRHMWRHGDLHDRASLIFYAVALPIVAANLFVDFPTWVYVLVCVGVVSNVGWSYFEMRKAMRHADAVLAKYRRQQEIEYFEWLHDASPDD